MLSKILINFFLIIGLVSFQYAFVSGLPDFLGVLNCIIIALVFILIINDLQTALIWAIGAGFFFDVLTFFPFGSNLFTLSAAVGIAYLFLSYVFTNRSLYSFLVIALIMTVVNTAGLSLIQYFRVLLFSEGATLPFTQAVFWKNMGIGAALNMAGVSVLFYFYHIISLRLKPVFILRGREELRFKSKNGINH